MSVKSMRLRGGTGVSPVLAAIGRRNRCEAQTRQLRLLSVEDRRHGRDAHTTGQPSHATLLTGSGFATTTRLRPECLALYKAASASSMSVGGGAWRRSDTPREHVTLTIPPLHLQVNSLTVWRMRSASSVAAEASVLGARTTNSS